LRKLSCDGSNFVCNKKSSGQATFSKLTQKDDDGLAVMVPVEKSSGEQNLHFLPAQNVTKLPA